MSSTMPTRIDGDLFEAARAAGAVHSRSAAQQIAHWARVGREFEASPRVSQRDVTRVLTGSASYDDLSEPAQAVVRATWEEGITQRLASLDLATRLAERGQHVRVVADADGNATRVHDQ